MNPVRRRSLAGPSCNAARPSRALLVIGALAPLACAGTHGSTPAGEPATRRLARGYGEEVRHGVARVRTATARFTIVDSALAAGYAPPSGCLGSPHGAMGYHYLNRSYLDGLVELDRPEILLYERRNDGRYVLNGVEFLVPFSRWPRDSVAPTLLGQSLKRADELRLWYLHVWVWHANPAGLFADWHPEVACPAS